MWCVFVFWWKVLCGILKGLLFYFFFVNGYFCVRCVVAPSMYGFVVLMLCGKFGVLLCDFVLCPNFWFVGVVIWAFLNYELPWIVLAYYCSHCIIGIVSVCFISQVVGFVVVNSSMCLEFFFLWRFLVLIFVCVCDGYCTVYLCLN